MQGLWNLRALHILHGNMQLWWIYALFEKKCKPLHNMLHLLDCALNYAIMHNCVFLEGLIVKLPKKGDHSKCNNYNANTLLSVPSKIFSRVILNRLQEAMDKRLRDQQAGFRKDRSCKDHIATLHINSELSMEWNTSLYIIFMDFEKAFDSLHRTSLWHLMDYCGIPTKITNFIKASYEGLSCKVIHAGPLYRSFKVRTGVKEGCLLSPFLFLLAIDWIMRETMRGGWDLVDTMGAAGWPWFCRWNSLAFTHTKTDTRKDR